MSTPEVPHSNNYKVTAFSELSLVTVISSVKTRSCALFYLSTQPFTTRQISYHLPSTTMQLPRSLLDRAGYPVNREHDDQMIYTVRGADIYLWIANAP